MVGIENLLKHALESVGLFQIGDQSGIPPAIRSQAPIASGTGQFERAHGSSRSPLYPKIMSRVPVMVPRTTGPTGRALIAGTSAESLVCRRYNYKIHAKSDKFARSENISHSFTR